MSKERWELTYIDLDVAGKTMHIRIKDTDGMMHERKDLPWDDYLGRRILTTLFASYMDSDQSNNTAEEGTLMHEDFAEQFAHTLPLID